MSSNKLGLQSGISVVLLRCDSCYEPLSGSQKFYQYFLCFPHYIKGWVDGCFSIFQLKACSCIYKRTGYKERLKAFHRSDIRHTCTYKCALVKWADCDSQCSVFSFTAPLEIDLLKLYVNRCSETGSLLFRKTIRNTEKSWIFLFYLIFIFI